MTWWYISFKMAPVGHGKHLKSKRGSTRDRREHPPIVLMWVLKFGSNVGSRASGFLTPPTRFPFKCGVREDKHLTSNIFVLNFFLCFVFLMNSCLNGGLKDFIEFFFASIIAEDPSHVWWTDIFLDGLKRPTVQYVKCRFLFLKLRTLEVSNQRIAQGRSI